MWFQVEFKLTNPNNNIDTPSTRDIYCNKVFEKKDCIFIVIAAFISDTKYYKFGQSNINVKNKKS